MRKTFAALLAICLLFSFLIAFAEESAEPDWANLTWEAAQEQAAAIEGETVSIPDTPYFIFLPADFEDRGVTEGQIQAGLLLDRSCEALNMTLKCQRMPLDAATFVLTYSNQEALAAGDTGTINGRDAYRLIFTDNPDGLQIHVLVQTDEGYTLQFIFDGVREDSEPLLYVILSSIR